MFPFRTWRKSLMWTPAGHISLSLSTFLLFPAKRCVPISCSSSVQQRRWTKQAESTFYTPSPLNSPCSFPKLDTTSRRDEDEVLSLRFSLKFWSFFFLCETFKLWMWLLATSAGVPHGWSAFYAASLFLSAQLHRSGQVRANTSTNIGFNGFDGMHAILV